MKVIFLVSSMGSGGAERVAATLCRAWVERGDDVILVPTFSGGGQPFYVLDERVKLRYLSDEVGPALGGGKRYGRRLMALRRMIREQQPDVVVSFLPNVNIAAIMATAFTGIPCVVCERSDPTARAMPWIWRRACQLLYRFADCVAVQTEAVAERIGELYGDLKRVAVVPNPLPQTLVSWPVASSRTVDPRVLLSLGRLASGKRVDWVISAFAELAPRYPDWVLHIYGDGPMAQSLANQMMTYPMEIRERIQLLGATTDPWAVMQAADAFVLASEVEGFPNALLEAMGLGLPCVTTDCRSGPREISRNGQDALLVPVGDLGALTQALGRVMGDAELRQTLGRQGRTSVHERYRLETVLTIWDDIFKSVGAWR